MLAGLVHRRSGVGVGELGQRLGITKVLAFLEGFALGT